MHGRLSMKMKFLCLIAPTLLLAACGQPKPIPYDCLVWVNNYYIKNPVESLSPTAAGWLFRGAKNHNGELRVGFLIPGPMSKDAKKRQAILEKVCPRKFEEIWQILPSNNKFVIRVWTENNRFKDSINC